jgi:hypothetical protein
MIQRNEWYTIAMTKKNTRRIIIGTILATGIGLGFAFLASFYSVYVVLSRPSTIAQEALVLIASEKYEDAYALSADIFKEQVSLDDFTVYLNAFPIISNPTSIDLESASIKKNIATVRGTLKKDAESSPIIFQLIQVDREWRFVNVSLSDLPAIDLELDEEA